MLPFVFIIIIQIIQYTYEVPNIWIVRFISQLKGSTAAKRLRTCALWVQAQAFWIFWWIFCLKFLDVLHRCFKNGKLIKWLYQIKNVSKDVRKDTRQETEKDARKWKTNPEIWLTALFWRGLGLFGLIDCWCKVCRNVHTFINAFIPITTSTMTQCYLRVNSDNQT